jgi:methylase of polypeptide subunit release factors
VLLRGLGDADERLGVLARMFLAEAPVDADAAGRALTSELLEELSEARLVEVGEDAVRAAVRIVPIGDLLVAHDRERGELARDHVVGVSLASTTLASLTVRRPVERTLDLGTGCGVQALLAAAHSGSVVAADLNERALWFCRLNAALNGIDNVESRQGDLFEPVEGDTFDLVVANPPFVMSPDTTYVFRDSSAGGEAVSRAVVENIPAVLAEGGFGCVLCNWAVEPGAEWSAAPRAWLAQHGCDAWLLHYRTDDPLTYAAMWNEQLRATDPEGYGATLERWLAYYEREGIEAIALGAVIMRRRDGSNWVRADEMRLAPTGLASDHLLRVFANQDLLESKGDDSLLEAPLALADDHRLDQTLLHTGGQYLPQEGRLVLANGVGVEGPVPPNAIHVLFRLDGSTPLREVVAEVARDTGVDADTLAPEAVRTVRRLVELGFVERGGG